jgi:hypothetical protein
MTSIAEEPLNKLVLRQNHLSLSRLLREIFLLGIGVGILVWSSPAKLNCQRIEPMQVTCQLSKPGWLGLGIWRNERIRNLQGVKLTQHIDDGVYYQVLLQTSAGEVPLRRYKTSGLDNTRESVNRINAFLKDPTATELIIVQVDWLQWFGFVSGMFFFLIGIRTLYVSLFSIRSKLIESYCINQAQNQLTYQYGGLLRQRQDTYAFSDIHRLVLDIDAWAKARLFLEMKSGELLCLSGQAHPSRQSPWQGVQWQQIQPVADEVSRRLHRSWQLALGLGQTWIEERMAHNKRGKAIARWFKANRKLLQVWVFDHSTNSVTCQDNKTVETYTLRDIVDVEVSPMQTSVASADSDDEKFYQVNYQITLVLTSGKQIPIQQFFSYSWKDKQATAQAQAEEAAQCIRQYIGKD